MYVTIKVPQKFHQLTIEDFFNGVSEDMLTVPDKDTHDTRTKIYSKTPESLLERIDIIKKIERIEHYNEKYKHLIDVDDKSLLYRSFKIPKRSGGLRQIDAPKPELMEALRELKRLLEQDLYANYHTSAFAYIKGRCTIDAVKRHQQNNSRWFLKLDFHDFFGSTTLEFVKTQLKQIFPFNEIYKYERGEKALDTALSLCFLNGGLPQGTPISPTLTNVMMIPIDHSLARLARENSPHLCYTRYADDLLISSDLSFVWKDVQQKIIDLLKQFEAPFELNTKKTRYGSSAGRNWNLGVMLNKDNQITIGHAKKKAFKVMIYTFMNDYIQGNFWDISDVQALNGDISYYRCVEKDNIDKILRDYSKKFGMSVMACIKKILKNEI